MLAAHVERVVRALFDVSFCQTSFQNSIHQKHFDLRCSSKCTV